jgi:hypothetical protein
MTTPCQPSYSLRSRRLLLLPLLLTLLACSAVQIPYKAYVGAERPATALALVRGDFFYRKDFLNSYVDAVRFQRVDDQVIENSRAWGEVQMMPGARELEVYYSWDMGARIGLAPAMVSYASSREAISRTLRFNVEAGRQYAVKAQPVFNGNPGDIGSLVHVDFWVEDDRGRVVLSREEGRYKPAQ